MKTSWLIGGGPECDLVVDLPSVSRRHCRLSRRPDGSLAVLDLGSTNGTYVNGLRVLAETTVRREDAVTLGLTVPMPWPDDAAPPLLADPSGGKAFRVGREGDNDFVIDSPEVSGHHARVVISPDGHQGVVEDLGSTNGTAVGGQGQRLPRSTFLPADVLYFGPVAIPASRFFAPSESSGLDTVPDLIFRGAVMSVGRDPTCDRVLDFPVVSGLHARFFRAGRQLMVEDLGSSNGTFVNARRVEKTSAVAPGDLIGLGSYVVRLVDEIGGEVPAAAFQAIPSASPPTLIPVRRTSAGALSPRAPYAIAAGLGLVCQSLVLAASIVAVGHWSTGSAMFGLGMGSVWVGLCAAFYENLLASTCPAGPAKALTRAALVTIASSSGLLCLVPMFVSDGARWPAAFGILGLTGLVGAAFGLVVVRLSGRLTRGIPVATGLFLVSGCLSAPVGASDEAGPISRPVAAAMPTRWCFEALCLLAAGEKADDPATDPVAAYFPATRDRCGPEACVAALLAMLGGLLYADAVIELLRADRPRPAAPASP